VQLLLDSLKQNERGLGVASAEQVRQEWRSADAAVIGSAIVSQVEKLADSPDLISRVGEFARSLVAPGWLGIIYFENRDKTGTPSTARPKTLGVRKLDQKCVRLWLINTRNNSSGDRNFLLKA